MILRLLATVTALLVVCLGLLVWQLSQGPLSLAFASPYLEDAVQGDGGEWHLDVGDLVLMSDLKIHARNLDLLAADGTPVLHLPDVVVRPSLRALTYGVVAVSAVEINDGEAHILRRPDGSFGISLAGALAAPQAGGDAGAKLLEDLLQPAHSDSAIGFLRQFGVTNARLTIEDVETGAAWAVEEANIALRRGAEGHQLTVKAALRGEKIDEMAVGLGADLEVHPAGDGFIVDGKARASGIDVARIGLYWPQNAAISARDWVTENVTKGTVPEAVLNLAFTSPKGTDFRLSRLDGSMRYEGLEVRWNDDAPPLTALVGTVAFDASSMRFKVASGMSTEIHVRSAQVDLLDLDTDKERITIGVNGEGPVGSVLRLIPAGTIKLPFETSGPAGLDLRVAFPLSASLSFADVDLEVAAEPRSVRLRHPSGDATVSGKVRYQKRPKREATVTADLAVGAAAFASGGFQWKQPAGKTGKVEIGLQLREGPLTLDPLRIDCPGLRAEGSVTIGDNSGDSGSARLRKVAYGGTDLDRAEIDWTPKGLQARLGDGTLDLAPLMGDDGDRSSGADDRPLDLDIETGKLRKVSFDADSWVENARATVVRRGDVWEKIEVRGELPRALWSTEAASGGSGETKTFAFHLRPTGPGWRLDGHTTDFGSLLRAINANDDVLGGVLQVDGRADRMNDGMVLRSHVKVTDFKVLDAPVLLRILTVSSLDRFVGTMRGSGLHFDALKGTVTMRGDRYELDNMRAHGSSLGWTAKGWIDTGSEKLQIEGAVIPANQANKVLRKIPFLGSLLLGADGRGLIAISYGVSGDLGNPKVSTNPLTALTPGFLREVWELGK